MQAAHPVELPRCDVDLARFPKKYGLPRRLRGQAGLHADMRELVAWLKAPIQTTRDGHSSASRTIKNIVKNVYLYLGFCHRQLEQEVFHLALFLDLDKYAAYIAFQVAKQNGRASITQQLSHARKVCSFLRRSADQERVTAISEVETWLRRVSQQIVKILPQPRKDVGLLVASKQWMDAAELAVFVERFRLEILALLPANLEVPLCEYTARQLHDATLANTLYGHIPPLRLSCVRTLQVCSPLVFL